MPCNWFWWILLYLIAETGIFCERELEAMKYNLGGFPVTSTKTKRLASAMRKMNSPGLFAGYVDENGPFFVDYDNLNEFITFLEACGGFTVW